MSKSRDNHGVAARPLNARSLALSALLGTHPPTLPARALVDLAELFGINPGTMRTALSRMVSAGDVRTAEGWYTLAPRLVERQVAQDAGRSRLDLPWDETWHAAVATVDQRGLADRRHVRSVMGNARFGELRPSVWLRPANLAAPVLDDDWLVSTGPVTGTPADVLVSRLWDLDALADESRRLAGRVDELATTLDITDPTALPAAFSLSADVVRFLRHDPLLPAELTPPGWPVEDLRLRYDQLEAAVQAMLRPILLTRH